MSYARARLWLGITGVGSWVVFATIALIAGLPEKFLSSDVTSTSNLFLQLSSVFGLFLLWQLPFDFLGGWWVPRSFNRSNQSFRAWLMQYSFAALGQASVFVVFGMLIVSFGQNFELLGGAAMVALGTMACFYVRNLLVEAHNVESETDMIKMKDVRKILESWKIKSPRINVVDHQDDGFTGGIIGFGKRASIVIPKSWLKFSAEQLATAIARRSIAINSGSYTRGVMLAFAWNFGGFLMCSFIPGAGFISAAALITTVCYFTIWTFVGLLVLPTLSRNASLNIDTQLKSRGISADLIRQTANTLDLQQDGEPSRPGMIETIFHPIPSVNRRNGSIATSNFEAWNVARTTLFLSWACLGLLSRSVHCNVGRPELWTMLPTD